jgi:hypothetical protein
VNHCLAAQLPGAPQLYKAGGSGDAAAAEEALGLLQQAAELSAEHYGKQHPGVLRAEFGLLVVFRSVAAWRLSVHHHTAQHSRCMLRASLFSRAAARCTTAVQSRWQRGRCCS